MNPPKSAVRRSRSSTLWHATMSAIWLQCRPYATAGRQCRPYGAAQRVGQGAPQHCGSAIGRRFAIVAKREASSGSSASRPYVGKVVHMSASPIVHMSASRPYVGKSSICRQVVHVSASRPYVGKSSICRQVVQPVTPVAAARSQTMPWRRRHQCDKHLPS
jgi:hypothetical protein